ncbi:hypothetical protein Tco_0662663 [Tanacetum coccineum]
MVAPQLKNLTVEYWQGLHLISAPELVSLLFKDYSYEPNKPDAHTIVDLLQQLHSVKYLTLNLEIFQVLSPLMELISYQPSPFVNLKSLKLLERSKCSDRTWESIESKTSSIVSKLCRIKELLTELPASRRSQIEKSFSRLCTEANIVMNAIMNSMKNPIRRKAIPFKYLLHEVALQQDTSF